jgi:hypothetical protein
MAYDEKDLDFAYKYPFSNEARDIAASLGKEIKKEYLDAGALRFRSILNKTAEKYSRLVPHSLKELYVISYPYARILASAMGDPLAIKSYAEGEARRCYNILKEEASDEDVGKLAKELSLRIRKEGDAYTIGFADYTAVPFRPKGMELVNQRLSMGMVFMDNDEMLRLIYARMLQEISKGLPIRKGEIPAEIMAFAKGIKLEMPHNKDSPRKTDSRYSWVEKLLKTPIADVRHRTVNLILAPYFVNVKGASVDEATAKITEYINMCKELNPNTNINQSYIKYQCSYAKNKGLRPLSLKRARELFGDAISW